MRRRAEHGGLPEWLYPVLSVLIVVHLVAGLTLLAVDARAGAVGPALAAAGSGPEALPLAEPTAGATAPAVAPTQSSPESRAESLPSPVTLPAPEPSSGPSSGPVGPAADAEPDPEAAAAPVVAPPRDPGPDERAKPRPAARTASQPQHQATAVSDSEQVFGQEFPAHASARQVEGDPATFHWAVIVGVNRYMGRTRNTLGSVADAQVLAAELRSRGWRDDQVLVLLDHDATHDRIVRAIEWLARKTDDRSTVLFSFSGHIRHQGGDPAGDGQWRDTGLWPTDNRYLWDSDFARMMSPVRARRMWISLQGCHAHGMSTPVLEQPGRVITYSSTEAEKSYEDPEVGHSVQGWFMFAEGIRDRFGDGNKDGRISAQEAYEWAAPRANIRTAGRQSPVLFDGLGQPFFLEI